MRESCKKSIVARNDCLYQPCSADYENRFLNNSDVRCFVIKNNVIFVQNTTLMSKIITEVTPLSEHDCFYLVDRNKAEFDYPVHKHEELEINFVTNCKGCQRIVGDSIETLDYFDLVIVGSNVEHGWLQNGVLPGQDMREITIQWVCCNGENDFLKKNQFASIRNLLMHARNGIAFGQKFTRSLLPRFEELVAPQPGFMRYLKLLEILFLMSVSDDWHQLSTIAFANVSDNSNSRRIRKIKEHIGKNYTETLRLDELAAMVNMTPSAFSRFFKSRTNQTLSEYIIDIRIGHAIRHLVDTTMTSSEICYACGFNNISNFNRLFRKKKGCSPMEFRENYIKTKIIV